jgi:hypothetical protein
LVEGHRITALKVAKLNLDDGLSIHPEKCVLTTGGIEVICKGIKLLKYRYEYAFKRENHSTISASFTWSLLYTK